MWITKAKNALGNDNQSGDGVLYHLSKIIDKSQLSPTYSKDSAYRYENPSSLLWGMNVRKIWKNRDWKTGKDEIKREDIGGWHDFNPNLVYLQTGGTSSVKDFYLSHTVGVFNTIRVKDDEELLKELVKPTEMDLTTGKMKPNIWTEDYVKGLIAKRNKLIDYIKVSKLYKSYDDVQVPEDWAKKFEASNTVDKEGTDVPVTIAPVFTPAELRKLNEKTVAHTLYKDQYRKDGLPFSWRKIEPKQSDLTNDETEIYYDHGDSDKLQLTTVLLFKMYNGKFDENSGLKLIRVSKSMPKKFLKKHKFIDEFYKVQTKETVGMSKQLVHWLTAKLINEKLNDIKFMRNYKSFNLEVQALYEEVKAYSQANFHENYMEYITKYATGQDFINGVLEYSGKVCELQMFIRDHADDAEAVKQKSSELFGIDTLTGAIGYNLEMYDKLQMLLDYAEPVKALFNHIDILTDIKTPAISMETETLIKEVIDSKGLSDFKVKSSEEVVVESPGIEDSESLELSDIQVETIN